MNLDTNRFFRFLWRLNALLLLAVSVLVLFGAGSMLYFAYATSHTGVVGMHIANPSKSDGGTYQLAGGAVFDYSQFARNVYVLPGTDEGLLKLQRAKSDGSYELSSGPVMQADVLNVLVVDLRSAKSRWMFPTNRQLILGQSDIHSQSAPQPAGEDSEQADSGSITAILLQIAPRDSVTGQVKDGERNLYLYRPHGAEPVLLMKAKSIESIQQIDAARILIVYTNADRRKALLLSAEDFKPIAESVLPDMLN